MLFSSLEFLYLFLPLCIGIYFLSPVRARNLILFFVSLLFYGFGEPVFIILMLGVITTDYFFGFLIGRSKKRKKLWLAVAIFFNLFLLAFFKYFSPMAKGLGFEDVNIPLPIGISFYIFQALSYLIDVYRGLPPEKSYIAFGTYISLFPQLIAGPIVKYTDIASELNGRRSKVSNIASGISTFSVGLTKKVLLANGAGIMAESLLLPQKSSASMWLGLIAFAFQIYYDFSGYSDMAIGLGRIFGFTFPENFNYPYISSNATEFWRRWHITLSSWFREYVYIPLGGNRKGTAKTYINLFAVWCLTGIWHGAAWNFLLWGAYFFIFLSIEKLFLLRLLKRLPHFLSHTYAISVILFGWLIFYLDGKSFSEIVGSFVRIFGFGDIPFTDPNFIYELLRSTPFILIMCLGATPLPKKIFTSIKTRAQSLGYLARDILTVSAILISTAYLVDTGYNPFLYFRF